VGPRQPPARSTEFELRSTVLEQRRRADCYGLGRAAATPPQAGSAGRGSPDRCLSRAVGAGLFVLGFAALGLGGLLLLLPPRPEGEPGHRRRLHVVRVAALAGGRGAVALMRGTVRTGALTFSAVEHYAATDGRDGAVRIGAATVERARAVGRAGATAGALGWSAVRIRAPKLWRLLVVAMRSLAREARAASIRSWIRTEPILRRVWAGCLAGLARVAEELAPLARSAAERVSAYVDSRCRPR